MNMHFIQRGFWGLVLVTAGVLFLLGQMGLIEFDIAYIASTYWPVIMIVYGITGFIWGWKQNWGSSFWSLMLSAVGTIFLLNNLDATDLTLGEMFQFMGPVALILLGFNIIFKPWKRNSKTDAAGWESWDGRKRPDRSGRSARQEAHSHRHTYNEGSAPSPDLSKRELTEEEEAVLKDVHGDIDVTKHSVPWQERGSEPSHRADQEPAQRKHGAHMGPHAEAHNGPRYDDFVRNVESGDVIHRHGFIGDVHLGKEAWELKPLMISHFIGDSVIDLTRAFIPLGETKITVSAFIGDVKIFVPNDLDVEIRVMASSMIGDMKVMDRRESGFFRSIRTQSAYYEEAQRKLIVTTSMLIGDVTIKKIG